MEQETEPKKTWSVSRREIIFLSCRKLIVHTEKVWRRVKHANSSCVYLHVRLIQSLILYGMRNYYQETMFVKIYVLNPALFIYNHKAFQMFQNPSMRSLQSSYFFRSLARACLQQIRQFILVFISFPEVIFSRLFITFHIHFLKFRKKDVNDGYSCNCYKSRKSFKSGRSAKWLFWNGTCAYPIYNTFYEELQVYKDILPSKGQFYMRSILQSIFCFYFSRILKQRQNHS